MGVLVFLFCIALFVILAQYLNHRSSVGQHEYTLASLGRAYDRLVDTNQTLRDRNAELCEEMRPKVSLSPAVKLLFEAYGGPEKAASMIAENYAKLDGRYVKAWQWLRQSHRKQKNFKRKWKNYREETRRLREELHLVRGLYEDATGV